MQLTKTNTTFNKQHARQALTYSDTELQTILLLWSETALNVYDLYF